MPLSSVKVSRDSWVALINENNCFAFTSHLISRMVNNGKYFRKVLGNLYFIKDASLHVVLADLSLAQGHLGFQGRGIDGIR